MAISPSLLVVSAAAVETFLVLQFAAEYSVVSSVSALLTCLVLLNFALLMVYNDLIYPTLLSPLRHLPGPKGGWPIVNYGLVQFERPSGRRFLKWMTEIPNEGLLYFRGILGADTLLVTNPAGLAEVLVTKAYAFEKLRNGKDLLRPVLGDGLVIVEGDVHKFQRKNIMPVFSFRHIKELYPMMWTKANSLTARLAKELEDKDTNVVELTDWTGKATLDMIGIAALGRDFNSVYNSDDELACLYSAMTKGQADKIAFFAVNLIFGPKLIGQIPLPMIKKAKAHIVQLRDICRRFVREKKDAIAKHGDDNFDILSTLLKSNNFSDDEAVDQMLTFLAAGHDTTSLAFTWTCHLLATHPKIQAKVRAEIQAAREKLDDAATDDGTLASTLESLPYLNGVFHETLRLYPTIPVTNRVCAAPGTTLLGHPIPVGTRLTFSIVAINRSPQLWGPDAAEFKPERWIEKDSGRPNNTGGASSNFNLMTFLHGPRSCIGQGFARAELRSLVAAMVSAFELEMADPHEEVVATGAITMRPQNGMKLKLTRIIDDEKS